MKKPGVSICIPNWNHRNFLPRSVRSARKTAGCLLKEGIECEILVVDDSSRDGSQRALAAMVALEGDALFDVVALDENRGLAAARNLLLHRCRFQYVCFLDADNELIAENLIYFVQSMNATNACVVYGNVICHDGEKAISLTSNCYIENSFYLKNYVDAFALYRADRLMCVGGFEETMSSHEDWEMFLHCLAEGELLVFVPICFGYYYIVPESMLQTETFDHPRMRRMFAQRLTSGSPPNIPRRMYHPELGWL